MADPIFCPACGTIHEHATQRFEELQATVTALGVEVARKQGTISRLRKQQVDERPPEYEDALEVAQYWRELLFPTARELNGPRLLNTIARLKAGYPKEELKKAIWGYWCRPNVYKGKRVRHDMGGDRRVDLELIMRDPTHVDQGLTIADEEIRFEQGAMNEGATRYVASRCECGHARGDHGLFRMQGHEGCYAEGCDCRDFDDSVWLLDRWQAEQRIKARRDEGRTVGERVRAYNDFDPSPVDVPAQGRLV